MPNPQGDTSGSGIMGFAYINDVCNNDISIDLNVDSLYLGNNKEYGLKLKNIAIDSSVITANIDINNCKIPTGYYRGILKMSYDDKIYFIKNDRILLGATQ